MCCIVVFHGLRSLHSNRGLVGITVRWRALSIFYFSMKLQENIEMVTYTSIVLASCGPCTTASVLNVVVEFVETLPSPVWEFCSSLVVSGSKVTITALEDAELPTRVDTLHKKERSEQKFHWYKCTWGLVMLLLAVRMSPHHWAHLKRMDCLLLVVVAKVLPLHQLLLSTCSKKKLS